MTNNVQHVSTYYRAEGYVYGRTWEFSKGLYKARIYHNYDKEKLLEDVKNDFKSGALDSGYGFESLLGARMTIETVDIIKYNGKNYGSHEYETLVLGEYPNQIEELDDCELLEEETE